MTSKIPLKIFLPLGHYIVVNRMANYKENNKKENTVIMEVTKNYQCFFFFPFFLYTYSTCQNLYERQTSHVR